MSENPYQLSWDDVYPARPGGRGDIKVVCPFCRPNSKHPQAKCLSVNQDTGLYNCQDDKCEAKGKISEERERDIVPSPRPSITHARVEQVNWEKPDLTGSVALTPDAIAFLASRGISHETAAKMRTHVKIDQVGRELIGFAYTDRTGKDIVHVKYRALGEKRFFSTKDTRRVFYGLSNLDDRPDTVIITEGEIDALSLMEVGYRNVISLPDGSNAPGKDGKPVRQGRKLDCMISAESQLLAAKRVVLAVDDDPAGDAMAQELTERIGINKTARVTFPEGFKDANEVLVGAGAAALRRAIDSASTPRLEGLSTPADYKDQLWERRFDTGLMGIPAPGFPILSDHARIIPGLLTVLTGVAGAGKSSFLRAYLLSIAGSVDDFPIAFFAPEDAAITWKFWAKFTAMITGKPVAEITRQEFDLVFTILEGRIYLIHPDSGDLDDILVRAEYSILNYGIRCVVIDPWTEVATKRLHGDSEVDHLNKCLTRLQNFARTKDVAVVIAAHPTKESALNKKAEHLTLYDISGAAAWANKTDVGISVRPSDDPHSTAVTEVHVVKVRDESYGKRGCIELSYESGTGRFTELGVKA